MQELKGKSGNSVIYMYEGYTYHMDKRLTNTCRCSTRRSTKCRGMVIIMKDGEIQVDPSHDHPRNEMVYRISQLKQEMYHRCQKTLEPLKKIFDDVCGNDPEAAVQLSYPMLKSTLHRKRIAFKPTIPNTFKSLALELEKYHGCEDTYKGSVTAEDGTMALLFSCDELFQALNDSTEIFVDGTFAVVPRKPMAAQLYTIHIRYMDTGIATVFALCESRTKALYRAMWEKIIEFTPSLQQNIKFIMGDYEKSAIVALHEAFPNASIHGCWFHYNQV